MNKEKGWINFQKQITEIKFKMAQNSKNLRLTLVIQVLNSKLGISNVISSLRFKTCMTKLQKIYRKIVYFSEILRTF